MTREMGSRDNESGVLGNLSICYHKLGDYDQSVDVGVQATAIAREVADRNLEACGLTFLADCYRDLGG